MSSSRISMDLVKIWLDLKGFCQDLAGSHRDLTESCQNSSDSRLREKGRAMNREILKGGSIGLSFSCEDPLTNPPVSVPRSGDSSPTVANIRSNGSQFDSNGLGGSNLDTPICIYEKRSTKKLHVGF